MNQPKARGRVYQGVCSSFLASYSASTSEAVVPAFVRESTFRLPAQLDTTPLLLVAAGTGVAPFRAFLQESKHYQQVKTSQEKNIAEWSLFFGCRTQARDYIYQVLT